MDKTFLDSVHGGIKISKDLCLKIIDTPFFQRLRRIEQNSCRAVYPSARHDRFIHSLGVYHLGCLISEHINEKCDCKPYNWNKISQTYKIACLLHDVGHTPFSHTFEDFYDRKSIIEELRAFFDNDGFNKDSDIPIDRYTPHELISAWLAIIVYSEALDEMGIDKELMARMIIGLPYKDEDKITRTDDFRNVMIELIHGTIDADGLDYVCRDVWAGGYDSFNVNINRLIESISIDNKDGKITLSFSSKALNEIEAVLNVKNFQFMYVINHHKVLLEQHYLVEGVKSAAVFHCDIADREDAIRKLCDYKTFVETGILEKTKYLLYRPSDDDFICLMKQTDLKDYHIDQWFSRNHKLKPLWKTRIEFFHIFKDVIDLLIDSFPNREIIGSNLAASICEMVSNTVDDACRKTIIDNLKITDNQIVCIKVKPKFRQFDPAKIKINLYGQLVDYTNLKYEGFKLDGVNADFHFWYIESEIYTTRKEDIIHEISSYLKDRLLNKH